MKVLKYVYFIYIVLALIFIFDGFQRLNNNEPHPWLSFLLGIGALAMFFFRRKYNQRFENHYKNKQ